MYCVNRYMSIQVVNFFATQVKKFCTKKSTRWFPNECLILISV